MRLLLFIIIWDKTVKVLFFLFFSFLKYFITKKKKYIYIYIYMTMRMRKNM